MKTAFWLFVLFVGFGLLPLWIALIVVFAGAQGITYSGSEYWAAAPWVIVYSLPVCVVTLAISTITTVIYFVRKVSKRDGLNPDREEPKDDTPSAVSIGKKPDDALKQAARGFGILVALSVMGVLGFLIWNGFKKEEVASIHRNRQAFVEKHPLVVSAMPPKFSVDVSQSRTVNDHAIQISYHVSSNDTASRTEYMAVIDVDRRGTESYQFKCLIPYADYQRLPSTGDVCRAWEEQQKMSPQAPAPTSAKSITP